MNYWQQPIRCEGQDVSINLPTAHEVVLISDKNRWLNCCRILKNVHRKMSQKRYQTDCLFSQTIWAIAMTACPALALSAAQHFIPLVILAYFYDTGLFDKNKLHENYASSFPSDWVLRKYVLNQACRDTIMLGNSIRSRRVYMACDKGNKKVLVTL